MPDFLIPQAMAQGISGTMTSAATAGRDVAVSGAESGIQAFFTYIISNVGNWIAGLVIVVIFWMIASMAARATKNAILKQHEDIQESALILVERMTKVLVLTVGITIALAINGLNFTAVLGALSLGIGFALKDIIGNFISSVILLSQDRIKIGDFINVNGILGTIVSIDTRVTVLQAIDGTEVVIPNQIMLGQTIISYTTNPFRRVELAVGVDYKTNLAMVTSLIKGVLEKDQDVMVKPEPLITVDEFGDSSITIMVRFWVESRAGWQKIRSNIAYRIKEAFDEVGVNIPFPIRTLKLDEDDRAFLKTMDSLKKGFVPEVAPVPSNEQIAAAALHTEKNVQIPYSVFRENEKAGQTASEASQKPAATVPDSHKITPPSAPVAPTAPASPPPASPPPASPPPTHL